MITRDPWAKRNNAHTVQPLKPEEKITSGRKADSFLRIESGVRINPRRESRRSFLRLTYPNPGSEGTSKKSSKPGAKPGQTKVNTPVCGHQATNSLKTGCQ